MDLFLIIGIIIGVSSVVGGMIVKGADVAVLLNPAAAIIILIGTFAAVMNSFPRKEFLRIPKVLGVLFKERDFGEPSDLIEQIVEMGKKARKNGLLILEEDRKNTGNRFLKKALGLIIDGMDGDYVREVLESEIEEMEERHRAGASVFSSAGSYAPTLGVLGAVIGLIGALGNLNDVEKLGHMIAAAFVATLYGIFTGYVIFHPFATRLKRKSQAEISNMRIVVEGVLLIQEGSNPQSIKIKLSGLLSPEQRANLENDE